MKSICESCEQQYTKKYKSQRFCCHICKEVFKNSEYTDKWLKKKTTEKRKSQKLMSNHAYMNTPNSVKKFNGVRG